MKLSQAAKENLQIIAMAIFGTLVVLYQNGYIFADKDDKKAKTEKNVQVPDSINVAARDTVAMQMFRDAKQLKR